jgi:cupin 2 domain-containing protein
LAPGSSSAPIRGVPTPNLLAALPRRLPDESFEPLSVGADVLVERIVSEGHATAEGVWLEQSREEWVMVVTGRARLRFEGEDGVRELGPMDHVRIDAGRRHRVEWTTPDEPTVWLAVHYPPVVRIPDAGDAGT